MKYAGVALALFGLAAFVPVAYFALAVFRQFRSRPLLRGRLEIAGLGAPVILERDRSGIPTVSGASRADVAFGLGFLHAQERFFQMDLSRRAASGEMAALRGKVFVRDDERARIHQFRKRATRIHAELSHDELAILDAYTSGVRSGLRNLRAVPFEYRLLKSRPEEWQPEDTLLIVFHLYRLLQDERADQDFHRYLLYTALPRPIADFLAPEGSPEWDAPMVGPPAAAMPVPGPEVMDFRRLLPKRIPHLQLGSSPVAGRNAWAVSGKHTHNGAAIVANDVHLPFAMPAAFYRATLDVAGRRLSGMTLPGFPFLVAGTNGDIAWGLTNAAIDASDLVLLDQSGLPADAYRTTDGVKQFVTECEIIRVRGGEDVAVTVRSTDWGPVTRKTRDGTLFAQCWLAHHPHAVNLAWGGLETATTAAEAVEAAHPLGVPTLAIVVGDRHGDVGWTLAGRMAWRTGGRLPTISAQLTGALHNYVPWEQYPRLRSPQFSRVWSANARAITSGVFGQALAGGLHSCGARASQIRDALGGIAQANEESMLRLQRDDRALFLSRWRALLLDTLQSTNLRHPRLAEFRATVEGWNGRAAADSVGYRVLRQFHAAVERLVFEPFISIVRAGRDPFNLASVTDQLETPLWRLMVERPPHLLPPWFPDWSALLAAAATETLDSLREDAPLASFTWGAANRLAMRHPLSPISRMVRGWLDISDDPLDGDMNTPLAQTSRHGPVFRFVISPGDGESAIAQMAGGQAGNRFAPYYLAGHADWLEGKPSPLQPGPARYRLILDPMS